jgi:hypothetical protein
MRPTPIPSAIGVLQTIINPETTNPQPIPFILSILTFFRCVLFDIGGNLSPPAETWRRFRSERKWLPGTEKPRGR